MEIIDKKKFTKTILVKNSKVFIVYMISFSFNLMPINPTQKAKIALLVAKKVKILTKYLDFLDILLEKKTLVLLKTIKLN